MSLCVDYHTKNLFLFYNKILTYLLIKSSFPAINSSKTTSRTSTSSVTTGPVCSVRLFESERASKTARNWDAVLSNISSNNRSVTVRGHGN